MQQPRRLISACAYARAGSRSARCALSIRCRSDRHAGNRRSPLDAGIQDSSRLRQGLSDRIRGRGRTTKPRLSTRQGELQVGSGATIRIALVIFRHQQLLSAALSSEYFRHESLEGDESRGAGPKMRGIKSHRDLSTVYLEFTTHNAPSRWFSRRHLAGVVGCETAA